MERRILILCLIFFCIKINILAQESLLMGHDRYSGISAVGQIPTQQIFNENYWDAHLFGESFSVENDFIYISDRSVLSSIFSNNIPSARPKEGITGENTSGILDYFNHDTTNLHFSSEMMGPSFAHTFNWNENRFSIGAFTRLRTYAETQNADNYLRFDNQGIPRPAVYELQPFSLNVMNWGEVGVNLAIDLFPYSELRWTVGTNIKFLAGFDAVRVKNLEDLTLNYEILPDESIRTTVSDYNVAAAFATSYDFENNSYSPKIKGKGLGFDIGISVSDMAEDSYSNEYDFRFNASLLDVGSIKFSGEDHRLNGIPLVFEDLDDVEFENPTQFMQELSTRIYGNPNQSLSGTDFRMGLPTSIAISGSKRIEENKYVNFNFIQRISLFENSLRRSNRISGSYLFQKRTLSYGVSLSLYEYKEVQAGAYLRLGPLLLGSENLLPLVFPQKKLHSADFFIAFKINPFWDTELKRHRRQKCNCD